MTYVFGLFNIMGLMRKTADYGAVEHIRGTIRPPPAIAGGVGVCT